MRVFVRFWSWIPTILLLALAGGLPAQSAVLPSGVYRLDAGSTSQGRCFPPCACPSQLPAPVLGTLKLTFADSDGLFDVYEVSDVNWTVLLGNEELRVVGSGTYRIGGEFALEQQLELDLTVGDQPSQHYFSGLVPAGGAAQIDVAISRNGMVCRDTVFDVRASLVPRSEIRPYRLYGDSAFQRGCVGMCDCPAGEPLPIRGSFGLVELVRDAASSELISRFAVVNVRWGVHLDRDGPNGLVPIRGFGSYEVGGEFALREQLVLDLDIGDEPTARFDSGLVVGGASFPKLDVRVVNGDPNCFETAIDVLARPRAARRRR